MASCIASATNASATRSARVRTHAIVEVIHRLLRHAAIVFVAAAPLWAYTPKSGAAEADRESKAEGCAACHGPRGVSQNPAIPSIAGQPHQFIVTQLVMFREERRKDPLMSPVATKMTNAEINGLADYFSKQALPPVRQPDAQVATKGRSITEQFYCVSCHGATLTGQLHVPRLAGQQRQYLVTQLRGFKAGTRFDMDGNMTAAMQGVPDADIEVLADYLSSLK